MSGLDVMTQRTVIGRVWLELVVKHYLACRDADTSRQAKLFDLIDSLTDEYPVSVQAEVTSYTTVEQAPAPSTPFVPKHDRPNGSAKTPAQTIADVSKHHPAEGAKTAA